MDINLKEHIADKVLANYKAWNEELMSKGKITGLPSDMMDYWDIQVPLQVVTTKLIYNHINSLHSFFDIYARFLYFCLNKAN